MDLEQALQIVKAAGYKVSKPRFKGSKGQKPLGYIETVNPFNHPFPHAKLRNVTLSSITRLNKFENDKAWKEYSLHMIENNDVRNFAYSRADELAKEYGWRAPR